MYVIDILEKGLLKRKDAFIYKTELKKLYTQSTDNIFKCLYIFIYIYLL